MASDRLFELAFQYKKTGIWKEMFEDQIFAVRLSGGRIGYVSIMGILGEHIAVALYIGEEGLKSYFTLQSREYEMLKETDYNPAYVNNKCLQLVFDDKDYLMPEEIEAAQNYAKKHNIRYRGRNSYPHFIKCEPGFFPVPVSEKTEEDDLVAMLEAVIEAVNGSISNGYDCRDFERTGNNPREIAMIERTDEGFRLTTVELPQVEPYSLPKGKEYDKLLSEEIKGLKKKGKMQAGLMIVPTPVGWEQSEAPVMPTLLCVIEEDSWIRYPVQPVALYESRTDVMLNKFMEMLIRAKHCPKVIKASDKYTEALLQKWCLDQKVLLTHEGFLPDLEACKTDMYRQLMEADEEPDPERIEYEKLKDNLDYLIQELATGRGALDRNSVDYLSAFIGAMESNVSDKMDSGIRNKLSELSRLIEDNKEPKKKAGKNRAKGNGNTDEKAPGRNKRKRKNKAVTISVSAGKGCYRHIRVPDSIVLSELANYILNVFGFDNDHLHAFFMDNRMWSDMDAYFTEYADDPYCETTEETMLFQTNIEEGKKFKFLFDFGNEWVFQCRILHIKNFDTNACLLLKSIGASPQQYPDFMDYAGDILYGENDDGT